MKKPVILCLAWLLLLSITAAAQEDIHPAGDADTHVLASLHALQEQVRQQGSDSNDALVDQAQEALKTEARLHDMPYYYYLSYQIAQSYYNQRGKQYHALKLLQDMQQEALNEEDAYGIWTSAKYLASMYIEQNDYVSAKPHLKRALALYDTATDPSIRNESPTRLYCDLADTYPIASDSVRVNVKKGMEHAKDEIDSLRCFYYQARLAALDKDLVTYRQLRDYCLKNASFPMITSDAQLFFSLMDAALDGSILQREEEIYKLSTVREMKVIANLCENNGHADFAFVVEKRLVNLMENELSYTNQSRISELDVSMGKAALSAELTTKEHKLVRISRTLSAVLALLLIVLVLYGLMYINNLNQRREKDEQQIRELLDANEKVRLANEAKTRFVQNMSHEVRTPLNAIVGFSQLLALPDGSLDPAEKEEFSGHIINNSKMLTMLLDDILNTSAMDKGDYRISYEDGEKDFMCQSAISSTEHRLQPGVKMYYQPLDPEHFTFRTDPRRVQQILINLLTNSCKNTPEGEIRLTSSLKANPGYVTFAVEDTGIGIPEAEAEAIFGRFTKLNQFAQGSGLGLSICRDIATRMGAKVYLDTSYKEKGCRFVLQVPVEPQENKTT